MGTLQGLLSAGGLSLTRILLAQRRKTMSELVKRLRKAKESFPVIADRPDVLFAETAGRLEELERELVEAVDRIEALEADKASLKEKLSLYLGGWPSLEQHIEELERDKQNLIKFVDELEAENKKLKRVTEHDAEHIAELEAQIKAVKGERYV
jgi:DNA repair exonuclease SbcCD ATPase subunit